MSDDSRVALLAPALLALVPLLVVGTGNVGEYTWGEFAAVAMLLALTGALVLVACSIALGRRRQSESVLVASLAVLWLVAAPLFADRIAVVAPRVSVPLLGVVVAVGIWAVLRGGTSRPALARGAGIFGLALAVLGVLGIRSAAGRVTALLSRSETARALLAPLPAPRGTHRPDIYVIVLDNLANDRVQRDVFGRSNREFEDSLRALGFAVPRATRSNYSWTPHSVTALLNLGHVRGLEQDLGSSATDWDVLYQLVQHNRAARWLHDAGYTIYFQPSVGFPGTHTLATPHVTYGNGADGALLTAFARNRLLAVTLHNSVPGRLLERIGVHPYYYSARLRALRTVADVAHEPGPKFVLAHSLVAHEPFVFDESCRPLSDRQVTQRGERRAYLAVVQCTEQLVLGAVTRILADSRTPPVIILQADHGPLSLRPPMEDADAVTPAQARERVGAFGAYLLPGVPAGALADTITPANVLRFVFRECLDAPIPPVPDSSYYVSLSRPFHFVNVTRYVTEPPGSDSSGRPVAQAGLGGPLASH